MNEREDRPEAVAVNRKKYDIQFENLGLVLPSRIEIMRVKKQIKKKNFFLLYILIYNSLIF